MKEELKPCPFCGGEAVLVDSGTDILIRCYCISCRNCRCNSDWLKTRKEAIGAWNRRANND